MEINWDDMRERVTRTLQDLIRFDTTNPPGNETACAVYIRDRLAAGGVEAVMLEAAPGRGSAVARISGDGSARPLLLMSHIDVVPAEANRWTYPPFAAEIHDSCVWGRGTLDTKGLTAVQMEIVLLLKRMGLPLKRDVILAATADEEMGGARGMGWLVENHFDWIDAEYAINEAGGDGSVMGNRWVFRCQTAEKGGCRITLRAHGNAGHASTPRGETAISTLVAALDRLVHARLPHHLVPTVDATIRSFSQVLSPPMDQMLLGLLDPEREAEILDQMPGRGFAALYRASLHNTATPTILRAGTKVNVIPSVAEAELDCRLLPGQTADDLVSEIRPHLGDQIEIEVLRSSPGVESAYQTPFFETIGQVMSEIEPNSLTVPYMTPGGTDAKHLIRKGVKVYGFFPTKNVAGQPNGMELAHGTDERLALDNLRFSSQVLWEIVRRFCTR